MINDPFAERTPHFEVQPNPVRDKRWFRSLKLLRDHFVVASTKLAPVQWAMVQCTDQPEAEIRESFQAACYYGLFKEVPNPFPHCGAVIQRGETQFCPPDQVRVIRPKLKWQFVFLGESASVQAFHDLAGRGGYLLRDCPPSTVGSFPDMYRNALLSADWIAWFVLIWCVAWQQPPGTLLDADRFWNTREEPRDENFFSSAMTLSVFDASIQVIDLLLEAADSPPQTATPVMNGGDHRTSESAGLEATPPDYYVAASQIVAGPNIQMTPAKEILEPVLSNAMETLTLLETAAPLEGQERHRSRLTPTSFNRIAFARIRDNVAATLAAMRRNLGVRDGSVEPVGVANLSPAQNLLVQRLVTAVSDLHAWFGDATLRPIPADLVEALRGSVEGLRRLDPEAQARSDGSLPTSGEPRALQGDEPTTTTRKSTVDVESKEWSIYMPKGVLSDILNCDGRDLKRLHGNIVERESRQRWRVSLDKCDAATVKRYEAWRSEARPKKKPRGKTANSLKLKQTRAD